MKNFSTQLSGQIGENIVVAELGRREIVATTFSGNVPDIDVLAYRNNKSIPIQIKALRSGSLSVQGQHYLNIEFEGNKQIVKGKNKGIDRNLIFVIVKIGQSLGEDVFYICKQGLIQDLVYKEYKSYLDKKGGVRPRNPKSTHCSYYEKDLLDYKDNWALIEKLL